jgi:hypothetical protein
MTLQIDNLPRPMFNALEKRARDEGRTLQEIVVETLVRGLAVDNPMKRDLSGVAGTMTADDANAIEELVKWTNESDLLTRTQD